MLLKALGILSLSLVLISCDPAGTTTKILDGDTLTTLPEGLKGLKVYKVAIDGDGSAIYVATLGGNTTSTQYSSGKASYSVILFDESFGSITKKEIPVKKIIMENDSIIVAEK